MFIVIEGGDGAGKGRQRTELIKHLDGKVKSLSTVDFPDHNSPLYKHLIHPALHEELTMSPSAWFLSFALDQLLWQEKIKPAVGSKDEYFISDGYFTTTIAYQCLLSKYFTVEQAENFAETFGLIKPDLTIFIDVDPKIAMERKTAEEGHDEGLDVFERSLQKQESIRSAFRQMSEKNIFGHWATVDGSLSIEGVRDEIIKVIEDKNLI